MPRLACVPRLFLVFCLGAFLPACGSLAERIQEPDTKFSEFPRGPYLQSASPGQMVIRWRTQTPSTGIVSFGVAENQLGRSVTEPAPATDHEVLLDGLTASTRYFYRVEGDDRIHNFTTPPPAGSPVPTRIWVLGDAGMADANQRRVRDAFLEWTGSRLPDFVLQLGDNAYYSGTDSEFQRGVFNMYGDLMRRVPFWSCLGNHETDQSTAFRDDYPYFFIYTFPRNGECGGVPSGTEHYYSFDYGNVHVISLDSTTARRSPDGMMARWLKADLAATKADWIICIFHHPVYTKGSHDSDSERELVEMRQNIAPILEAGGVDLVINGHSHCYERSPLLNGHYGKSSTIRQEFRLSQGSGFPEPYRKPAGRQANSGTLYTVAGSAGKISGGDLNHPAYIVSRNQLGSLVLDITGNRLDAVFIRDTGEIADRYSILKE